jgi:hypothetical protein
VIDFPGALEALANAKVEIIIVGGAAATAHGSSRLTNDLDFVYRRTPENMKRLVEALRPLQPYPRGAPKGLPFTWDEPTIRNGCNFTLVTTAGDIDVLGEITGGGSYDALLNASEPMTLFGHEFAVLEIEMLIHTKRAAGRPKDFEAIAELELILDERKKP